MTLPRLGLFLSSQYKIGISIRLTCLFLLDWEGKRFLLAAFERCKRRTLVRTDRGLLELNLKFCGSMRRSPSGRV